ncbi:hypothetical protein COBT_003539 [Conglomerata obtusa]
MTRDSSDFEDNEFQRYKQKRLAEINKLHTTPSIDTYTDETALIKKSKSDTMIVHFYNEKFSKCKIMDANLEKVCMFFKGVEFIRIDAALCPTFAEKLQITVLPFLAFFKNGFFIDHVVGFEGFGSHSFEVNDLVAFIKKSEMFKK